MTERILLYRKIIDVSGVVQGVGFRPRIQVIAQQDGLTGWVQNRSGTVRICLEGAHATVDKFIATLGDRIPPMAKVAIIQEVESASIAAEKKHEHFFIKESEAIGHYNIVIPADLAMCQDCQKDIHDKNSRFFRYPFTTCTNCGPRYTVVNGLPYDRQQTTLEKFSLCKWCHDDYTTIENRRFHAESIACPHCGPQLVLQDMKGNLFDGDPVAVVQKALLEGAIVALKGLGGYQLVVDARNKKTIETLRVRKHRAHKPFAIMARNLERIKQISQVSVQLQSVLTSPQRPICILDIEDAARKLLPMASLTPDAFTVGCMLPTTPLHDLLFYTHNSLGEQEALFDYLVVTSGNRGGEPICIAEDEAMERLQGIADLLLCHDRHINLRNDDSVGRDQNGHFQIWRRARGYVPEPLFISGTLQQPVLAMGAELKNTIALGFGNQIVLSSHIGDLQSPEALDALEQVSASFPDFFKKPPAMIAVDNHPDYHSRLLGEQLAKEMKIPIVHIQHHLAHAAAAMAEHGLQNALAVVFDGTGYGLDDSIWGAELLHVTPDNWQRLGSFTASPLPGGDMAVKDPIRQVVARLWQAGCTEEKIASLLPQVSVEKIKAWMWQCEKKINAPVSRAAGRLFDTFSAAIGVQEGMTTYEGQAAIRLENIARQAIKNVSDVFTYDHFLQDNTYLIDWASLFVTIFDDTRNQADLAYIFHNTVSKAIEDMVSYGVEKTKCTQVVVTGGVFMNSLLTYLTIGKLQNLGLQVSMHRDMPPNDGSISLGQVMVAGGLLGCV